MSKVQSIRFSDELEQEIEDYRRKQDKIPSFNDAVLELVARGLKAK